MSQVCHDRFTVEGNDINVVPSDVLGQFHILLQATKLSVIALLQVRSSRFSGPFLHDNKSSSFSTCFLKTACKGFLTSSAQW